MVFAVRRARSTYAALSVSFVNQAVSSATNFVLGICFVRWMAADAFGAYGIAIALILLFGGIGNALFLTQMVVHLPDKQESTRAGYIGRVLALVGALSTLVIVTALLFFAFDSSGRSSAGIGALALLTALASAAYLLKDFFVRVAYSSRRESSALFTTSATCIASMLGLVLLVWTRHNVTPAMAVAVFGTGQLAGAIAGFVACRGLLHFHEMSAIPQDLREALRGGRWALGGVGVTWLQTQAYVYLTALLVGPAGVGYANAARLFVSPFLLAMPAINQVTLPRMAALRTQDPDRVIGLGRRVTRLVLLGAAAYGAVLLVGYPLASGWVAGGKYPGLGPVVVAWFAVLFMQLTRDGASTVLQALRQFKRLTVCGAIVACFSVPIVAFLAHSFGARGAVFATAIAECMLALVLWQQLRRHGG